MSDATAREGDGMNIEPSGRPAATPSEREVADLRRRIHELEETTRLTREDLETARSIQRMFLPDPRRQLFPRHLHSAYRFLPEKEVGGDFYDLKALDEHRAAILMADVSGHGMPAAFVTGLIKTVFEFGRCMGDTPAQFMAELNNVLERLTPAHCFAAVMFLVYDIRSRRISFVNAGHSPVPIIIRGRSHEVEFVEEPVDLLAGVNPDMTYVEGAIQLEPGDKLVLCTDGLPDAANEAEERFGLQRLHAELTAAAAMPPGALCDHLIRSVQQFSGQRPRSDDQTLIVMEVLPPSGGG